MTRLNFTFQETSPLITYSGWVEGSSSNDSLSSSYDGSFRVTFTEGATASFTFSGTAVSLFGATRANHGNYSVKLDQQPLFEAVGSTQDNFFNKSLWHADNLGYTEHTVVLTNIPTRTGVFLDLDYVSIERHIGQDGDTIFQTALDDASPAVNYVGSWEQTTGRSTAYQGTLHTTNAANSQAVITFQGCCLELYGQYANAPYSVSLDNHIPVTMRGLDIDLTADFQHPQTLLYLIDGLSEGNHTATLTNVKSNVNRPFFFDYAVVRSTQNITSNGTVPPNLIPSRPAGLHRSTPVGAIVGASVGGVTLIAMLIILYLFIRRRSRHKADRAFPLDLIEESELEPKPFTLPNRPDAATQGNPHGSEGFIYPSKRHAADLYPRSASTSQDGLLDSQEAYSAEGSSSYEVAPSASTNTAILPTRASASASTRGRGTKSRVSSSHHAAGESAEHPAVQEEDAGVVISSEDGPVARTLPPAYNPEWHRREES